MSSPIEPPLTGDEAVDEVLSKVTALAEIPVDDHPEVLREAQHVLQGYLNSSQYAS